MRFLYRTKAGRLQVTDEITDEAERPPYAILSHTWVANESEEVSFSDIVSDTYEGKEGYKKIKFCLDQAAKDDLEHVWIDTCCLDKSNIYTDRSSMLEFQEALNSMFTWYRNPTRCYVYLMDISVQSWQSAFSKSRWFTRLWTLQELLAPRSVEFFSVEGVRLGDKNTLQQQIYETTSIPVSALQGTDLSTFPVKQRLAWAEHRQARREEDKAYSLMGIFGVSMAWMYGEGGRHAMKRLIGGYEAEETAIRLRDMHSSPGFNDQSDESVAGGNYHSDFD